MNKHALIVLLTTACLAACSNTANKDEFNSNQVRQERFLVTNKKLPASFADIQQSLFKHRDACQIYFEFRPDPQQVHYATLVYRQNQEDDLRESVFADLTAYASGNVQMDVYAYYAHNHDLAYALLRALSEPEHCPR